jgi:putative serine protease PepD
VTETRSRALRGPQVTALALVGVVSALLLGLLGGAVGLAAVVLVSGGAQGPAVGIPPAGAEAEPRAPDTVAGVVRSTLPSVASVIVQAGFESGSGSGFVLRSDGYLVTNNHVIDAALANDGTVEVALSDGRRLAAEVVGRNVSYDVAVLRVDDDGLPPLVAEAAPAEVGDSVIVIGAPLGYDFTVTTGIVSAIDRPVTVGVADDASYISAIQTDAPINPGNSGGPVVDGEGRFIGMASSMATLARGSSAGSIGLGFAIPARAVVRIANEIIATGASRTPIMGVTLDPSFPGQGALIESVTPGGPAQRGGLRAGDVIVRLGSRQIGDADELVVAIRDQLPGEEVTVQARRGNRLIDTTVTLDSREDR